MFRRLFYKRRKFFGDDFDWDNYTADSYHRRLKSDVEAIYRASFKEGELKFDAETGHVAPQDAPISPNQRLVMELIGQLSPASVHEVGCGGGDHLATVAALYPSIEVTGGDRGATQLELALERHPQLVGKLGLQDLTMAYSKHWPVVDFAYSVVVVMHIHTAVSHFIALANMVRMARKYVLLLENNQCHNLVQDISNLFEGGHLDWDDLHIYRVDGSTGARGILLSREALDYPKLNSDAQIREGVKPSGRRLRRAQDDSARGIFGFADPG